MFKSEKVKKALKVIQEEVDAAELALNKNDGAAALEILKGIHQEFEDQVLNVGEFIISRHSPLHNKIRAFFVKPQEKQG